MNEQRIQQGSPDPGFGADFIEALTAWKRAPLLPTLTVLVELLLIAPTGNGLLALPVSLFSVSWPGVQRAWYLRAFEERRLGLRELPTLWKAYFGRFFFTGVIVSLVFLPFILFAFARFDDSNPSDTAFRVAIGVLAIATDFALTFVTPALAFTTDAPWVAIRLGLRMIRATWPACALYVLLPPLALQLLFGVSRTFDPLRAVALVASALLALICKGATLRFYIRRTGVVDSTWLGRQPVDGSLPPSDFA